MNIEKTFIQKVSASFPGCEQAIYSLIEHNGIDTASMQKYLIRTEFKEILTKEGGVQKMIVYSDLAAKYCTTLDKVRHIIRNY